MSKTILMNNGKILRLVSGKIPRYSPPVIASIPTVTSNLTYNGSAQSPSNPSPHKNCFSEAGAKGEM